MSVLVTGHEGFIGSALMKFFKNKNYFVYGMEKSYLKDKNYSTWQINLLEYLEIIKPDCVFHVGACADTQNYDVNYMMKYNAECTMLISNWCKVKEVPMIYSSSAACYGVDGEPNTIYSWSKYLGEQTVIANKQIALRYFNVYGFDERHKGKMASVAYQSYLKHSRGDVVKLFPSEPKRDFVYIKDVVNANYLALLNYNENRGKFFDVGTGNARKFEDVLNIIGVPYKYTTINEIPSGYQFNTKSSKSKFLKGWKPYYSLEEGLDTYLRELSSFSNNKYIQSVL
jgi:ADP-L-glycero-D-manno-heptose 6-epimerase